MLLLNYAHPLTNEQQAQLAELLGGQPEERALQAQIDRAVPLTDAARSLADAAALSSHAWQTEPLLINPPALAPVALALLAELHGRCGYFLPVLNIRPVTDSTPPRFEVAEVVNLQALRDVARNKR
jgi:hypothetical protein